MNTNFTKEDLEIMRKGLFFLYMNLPAREEHKEELEKVGNLYNALTETLKGDK